MGKTLSVMLSIATLLVAATLFAHGGLVHTMGTVAAVDANHIEVKTQDGATVSIQLTGDTKYLKGKAPAKASDVSVGMRVMVESKKDREKLVAAEVKLGTGKPAEEPRH